MMKYTFLGELDSIIKGDTYSLSLKRCDDSVCIFHSDSCVSLEGQTGCHYVTTGEERVPERSASRCRKILTDIS